MKSVPVTLNVTLLPIVTVVPSSVQFNIAPGAAAVSKWIQLNNTGASALTISGATVSSGAAWLTTAISGSTVVATGDPNGACGGQVYGDDYDCQQCEERSVHGAGGDGRSCDRSPSELFSRGLSITRCSRWAERCRPAILC